MGVIPETGLVAATALVVMSLLGCREETGRNGTTSAIADSCANALAAQASDLERDRQAPRAFDAYPAPLIRVARLADLDENSSRYARTFRTKLREAVAETGINFAGRYSIVAVGMTGWGNNYWIIDRRNGRAWEFPFHAAALEFRADSRLIVMNPRDSIAQMLETMGGGCPYLNQQRVSDLRPFSFSWNDDSLVQITPAESRPPVNTFWVDYLSGIPENTPVPESHFIRMVRTRVIASTRRVPIEGYTGFMIIEALPGIVPEDFDGVPAVGGQYDAVNGRLQFTGDGSLVAPGIEATGMSILLSRISARLGIPAATDRDEETIVARLSRAMQR